MKKFMHISLLSLVAGLFLNPTILAEENIEPQTPSISAEKKNSENPTLPVQPSTSISENKTNTIQDDSYFQANGERFSSGWFYYKDHWYYAQPNGEILRNQWSQINNRWYYFNAEGIMKSSEWHNRYYLKANGAMAEKEWIFDNQYNSWFYLTENGSYLENQWHDRYYLKSGGYMAKNEWIFDSKYNSWFYLTENGSYLENQWHDHYYLKSGGYMAKNEWIFDSVKSAWFYLRNTGQYATNYFTVGQQPHYFQSDGIWVKEIAQGFTPGQYSKVIFLDPGHGGKDPGATYYGMAEKELNMQIYHKLRPLLEERGYKVLTSRSDDTYVDFVTERSRMVNQTDADMFISIHFNARGTGDRPDANGIQTYRYDPNIGSTPRINHTWHNNTNRLRESNRLSKNIHTALLTETGAANAGELPSNFAVLRETNKPAVLLELGYMDHVEEAKKIRTEDYQNKIVQGIIKGIESYYAGK